MHRDDVSSASFSDEVQSKSAKKIDEVSQIFGYRPLYPKCRPEQVPHVAAIHGCSAENADICDY